MKTMKTIFTINRALDFSLNQSNLHFYSSQSSSADLNIEWFALDSNGFLKDPTQSIEKKPGVYIFQSLLDEEKIYIGSASNLLERFNRHRRNVNSGNNSCPIFQKSLCDFGWNNLRFGILEYINLELHPGGGNDKSKSNTKIKKEMNP